MTQQLFKYGIAFLLFAVLMQSCSEDTELISSEESEFRDNRRGNGRNGNGDNDGNGNDNDNGNNNEQRLSRLHNDIVEEWTDLFLELDRYAEGMRPNSTSRALAYIHLGVYETALAGMRGYVSNTTYLSGLEIDHDQQAENINYELAINAAYAVLMDHFVINISSDLAQEIDRLENQMERRLSRDIRREAVEESQEWGIYVAEQVISYALTDQAAMDQIYDPQPLSYDPPSGDGYWTFSAEPERALFPYWESVRTFVIAPDETSTVPPIAYSEDPSSEYYKQMLEVYEVNNTAKSEDNEQLWIAEFWSDDVTGLTFSPPARQYAIANQLIEQYDMNLEETIAFYLKLGYALNDAAVATWKYKYQYMVMRPNVYIHEFIDSDFQTNLYRLIPWPNPTFPGYPSGHSAFASAAAGVFIDLFGDETDFTDKSHEGRTEFRSTPRTYSTFTEMAAENGYSRIPLGVHIKMDCTEGLRLGYEIADAVNTLQLTR